jgi:hypothetical protein
MKGSIMRTLVVWSTRSLALFIFAILLNASRQMYPPIGAIFFNIVVGSILLGGTALLDRILRNMARAKFLRESNINATQF